MDINRRKFIQNTSLGLLSSLIPLPVSANIFFDDDLPPLTLGERLKKAADFRKEGKINRAINQFTRIINDYPEEIRAYDGLRKSLLQRKFKELEVLELYENGFTLNPDSKDFKERLAKEYMRLILGNKKFTNQYNSSENLLIKARNFFRQLKNEYPERPEYLELFRKAKRKINQQADTLDARNNAQIKTYKKEQKQKFRKRFKNKTDTEVEAKLNQLLSKPENEIRKKHIEELYRILIRRNKKNKNWTQAFGFALALYNFNKANPLSLKIVKRLANKTENFDELVTICQENHNLQNTFWSKLGFFDALLKRYNKTGSGNLSEMNQLLTELINETAEPQQTIEVKERSIRLAYKQQDLTTALENLTVLGQLLSGTENAHLSVRYTVLVARYFTKQREFNKGIQTIQTALGQKSETSDELLQLVQEVNQEVTIEKEAHVERLNKVLERLNNRQNP